MPASQTTAAREARVRRALARDGLAIRKGRARTWSLDDQGGYMVIDPRRNAVVAGENYDLDLEALEVEWMKVG